MKNNNNKTIQEIMKDVYLSKNYMDITFEGVLLGQAVLQKSLSVKKNQRDGQAKGVETKLKKRKEAKLYLQYLMAEHGIKKLTRSNSAILLPEMHQKGYRYSLESLYNMI